MNCVDCGRPVHLSVFSCHICGRQIFCHDAARDSLGCPGTRTHVEAVTSA